MTPRPPSFLFKRAEFVETCLNNMSFAWAETVALGRWLAGIPRLVSINGWPTDRCPKLFRGDIEAPNLAALEDYISKLSGAGMCCGGEPACSKRQSR